jgi:hypothetical protein
MLGYDRLFTPSAEAIPPNFRDLWVLAGLVLEIHPSVVLEYGSGYSTYVIAETLKRIGHGRLVSVELDESWRAKTEHLLDNGTRDLVEFTAPTPKVVLYDNSQTISFEALHILKPDLVYVDGPDPRQVDGYTGEPIVSDLTVFERERRITICVDGRDQQCEFLAAHLSGHYAIDVYRPKRFTVMKPLQTSVGIK